MPKQTSLKTQIFTFEFVELLLEAKKPKQTGPEFLLSVNKKK